RGAALLRLPATDDPVRQLHLALERELPAALAGERGEEARVRTLASLGEVELEKVAVRARRARGVHVARLLAGRPDLLWQEHRQPALLLDLRRELAELVRHVDLGRRRRERRHGHCRYGDQRDGHCDRTANGGLL